jgi:LPXTG-motif cell wall-anchored protein
VSITEVPPESTEEGKATKGGRLPKTGDAGIPVAPIAGLCAAAGLSLAGARALRRRGRHGEPDVRIERGAEGGTDPLGGGGADD